MKLPITIFFIFLISVVSALDIAEDSSVIGINMNPLELRSFLELTDTPSSYSGQGEQCVKVNAGETALEFGDCGNASGNASGDITSVQGDEYITNGSNSGPVNLVFNATLLNETINQLENDTAQNPFDQELNTTESPTFSHVNITNNLTVYDSANITNYVTPTGEDMWSIYSQNDDLVHDYSTVGGANYVEWATTNAFLNLWANPNAANGYKLFTITETQGADTNMNFYEGGVGHNRFWSSGSARFGGGEDYLCSNVTSDVDCNTGDGSGTDIVVADDGWFGGKLFASDWTNVTITESQITDLTHTVDTNETGRFENLTGTECSAGEFVFGVDGNGIVECNSETAPPAPQNLWETFDDDYGVSVTASSSTDLFTFSDGNGIRQDIVGTSIQTNMSGSYTGDFDVSGELKGDSLNITGTYARIPRTRSPLTIAFNSTYNNTDERVLTVAISGRVTAYAAADEEMVYAEIYNGTDYINLTKDGIHYYDGAGAALGQVFAAHYELNFEVLPGENYSIRYIHTNAVQVPLIDEAWGYY